LSPKDKSPQSAPDAKPGFPLNQSEDRQAYRVWVRFSTLGIQWAVLLLCAAWFGQKLDGWVGSDRPYLTAITILIALAGVFRSLIRSLSEINAPKGEGKPTPDEPVDSTAGTDKENKAN